MLDLIVFSYHRPLQLYGLLESIGRYVTGITNTYVIYRADQEQFESAYKQVFDTFSLVIPIKEITTSQKDNFYNLTARTIENSQSSYFMFAVDDLIVKDDIDIFEGIKVLEQSQSYGLFYRLGLHLSRCYPLTKPGDPTSGFQALPPLEKVNDTMYYRWKFKEGSGDWNYPHTVDMTLYRKEDVKRMLSIVPKFYTPNQLESFWTSVQPKQLYGICYQLSKVVNIPSNRVQNEYDNRVMNSYTVEELLDIFEKGFKIDISPLNKIKNESAHIDYELSFIKRVTS
jgi:hypothetical protein